MFQTCPSGNFFEFKAIAIGARSQSARTYIEKNYDAFKNETKDNLIVHALKSLQGTTGDNVELTRKNCSIGIVGKDQAFTIIEDEQIQKYLDLIKPGDQAADQGTDQMEESS